MVLCLRGANEQDLVKLRADTNAADDFLFDDEAYKKGDLVDFDKAWHALQFMFTGSGDESDHPLSLIPTNPERIGTDNGYGGPWLISQARVVAFNAALSELTDKQLESRYDPAAMAERDIYLADMFVEEGSEALEYIMQSIPELRALVARCADEKSGMVGIIT